MMANKSHVWINKNPSRSKISHNVVSIESTKFRSGDVNPKYKSYVFSEDNNHGMFMGTNISEHYRVIRSRFLWICFIILMIEFILLIWPITATVIWKLQAVLNWIWFLYGVRCLLLVWAMLSSSTIAFEKMWGTGKYSWKQFYRLYGTFRPSSSLFGWSTISFICGVVLGVIILIVSASLYTFYESLTLYILTLCIGVISVLEFFISPFVLYSYGLSFQLV